MMMMIMLLDYLVPSPIIYYTKSTMTVEGTDHSFKDKRFKHEGSNITSAATDLPFEDEKRLESQRGVGIG